jgi:hypothetical protein
MSQGCWCVLFIFSGKRGSWLERNKGGLLIDCWECWAGFWGGVLGHFRFSKPVVMGVGDNYVPINKYDLLVFDTGYNLRITGP